MRSYKESKQVLGLFLIGIGMASILLGTIFRLMHLPGSFIGLYSGPVLMLAGGVVIILNND